MEQSAQDKVIRMPNFHISTKNFKIRNYGSAYFFPQPSLREGLEEVVIFTEDNKKRYIPNGSVWVYDESREYIPQILLSDIGCGITAFLTEEIDCSGRSAEEIVKILSNMGLNIGRGNHFIDFTSSHPKTEEGGMIFLHSDFNPENKIPGDYESAKALEKEAREKRIGALGSIIEKLGIGGEYYKDWTHNSVERGEGMTIYRKGAIDISLSEGEGILALNHFEGLYLYVSDWPRYRSSMQHATGKRNAKKCDMSGVKAIRMDGVEGLLIESSPTPEDIYEEFNPKDRFYDTFIFEHRPLGYAVPKLVVRGC